MAALPPLQYHITRMGPDPEREKLNRILEDARKRFSTIDGDITFLKAQIVALTGVNGVVTSVNGQQGDVTISIASLGGVPITRTISSGQGLTGGGNLSADRTLSAKISTDPGNTITFGTDDGLFSAGGGGGGGGAGIIYADFEATPGQLIPGAQSPRITVPFDFEIKSWRISAKAGQAGAATFDVLYSSSHSGAVASVVGSVAPSMVASNTAAGSDMTGWTVSGAAGGVIVFQLDGVGGLTAARIELIVEKQ
jgi:hypothetical protein